MDPAQINVNVLRRHDPEISVIIDSTSYVVLYRFAHGAWAKTGLEGTLFVYQREVAPYFGVFVLNRQGLENFCEPLAAGWDVDLDDGLVIWRNDGATGQKDEDVIHGIWVYEAEHRERLVSCMQKLIALSEPIVPDEPGREPTPAPPPPNISHPVPRMPIIPSGQSISLDELFGVSSVTAEPPPITSALPLPSHSGDDDDRDHRSNATISNRGRDRDVEYDPPQTVKSPDPSDLPKGMELLNSLFQRAGVKGQPASAGQGSPQDPSQAMGSPQQAQPRQRQRRRSSADEAQAYQPVSYGQPLPQPAHSGAHHMAYPPQQHPQASRDRGNSQSRRSSGGSSHGRTDLGGQKPVSIDPAEARMGILTAINHPAAVALQQSGQQAVASNGGQQPYGSSGYPQQSSLQSQAGQLGVYGSPTVPSQYQSPSGGADMAARTPPYGPVTRSQYTEQNPAGYSHQGYQSQQPQGVDQGHPVRRSPVRNSSPPKQGNGQPTGTGGMGYVGNAWPYDNLPKRALSPLNPAAQTTGQSQRGYQQLGTHAHHQHQPYGHHAPNGRGQSVPRGGATALHSSQGSSAGAGGGGSGQVYGSPGNQAFSMPYGSPQSQGQQAAPGSMSSPQTGAGAGAGGAGQPVYPPQVNDSSRPRQGSQGSAHQQRTSGGGSSQVLSPKWAAEAVDDGLVGSGTGLEGAAGGGASLEKRDFRDGLVHLLQNNPLFLDRIYATYLRRCVDERF